MHKGKLDSVLVLQKAAESTMQPNVSLGTLSGSRCSAGAPGLAGHSRNYRRKAAAAMLCGRCRLLLVLLSA